MHAESYDNTLLLLYVAGICTEYDKDYVWTHKCNDYNMYNDTDGDYMNSCNCVESGESSRLNYKNEYKRFFSAKFFVKIMEIIMNIIVSVFSVPWSDFINPL